MKRLIILMISLLSSMSLTAKECIPTPHRTTGTHYKPVTVEKVDVGKGLRVTGRVIASSDCKPVTNAKVAHWQAGENGRYRDQLRAYLYTNKNGRFSFDTEWPNLTPPHIHFIVEAKGYHLLETQWIGSNRQEQIEFTIVLEEQ